MLSARERAQDLQVEKTIDKFIGLINGIKVHKIHVAISKNVPDKVRSDVQGSIKPMCVEFIETNEASREHMAANTARRVGEAILLYRAPREVGSSKRVLYMGFHIDRVWRKRWPGTVFHPTDKFTSSKDHTRLTDSKLCARLPFFEPVPPEKQDRRQQEHFHDWFVTEVQGLDRLKASQGFECGLSMSIGRTHNVLDIIHLMDRVGIKVWHGIEYGHPNMFSLSDRIRLVGAEMSVRLDKTNGVLIYEFDDAVTPSVAHPVANMIGFFSYGVYNVRGKWWKVQQLNPFKWGVHYSIVQTTSPSAIPPPIVMPSDYYEVISWMPQMVTATRWKVRAVTFQVHQSVHKTVWTNMLEQYTRTKKPVPMTDVLRIVNNANAEKIFNMTFVQAVELVGSDMVFPYAMACYVCVNAELASLEFMTVKAQSSLQMLFSKADFKNAFIEFFKLRFDAMLEHVTNFVKVLSDSVFKRRFEINLLKLETNPIRHSDIYRFFPLEAIRSFEPEGLEPPPDLDEISRLLAESFPNQDEEVLDALRKEEEDPATIEEIEDESTALDGVLSESFAREAVEDLRAFHMAEKNHYTEQLQQIGYQMSDVPYFEENRQARYRLNFSKGTCRLLVFDKAPWYRRSNQIHSEIVEKWRKYGVSMYVKTLTDYRDESMISEVGSWGRGRLLLWTDSNVGLKYNAESKTLTTSFKGDFSIAVLDKTASWVTDRWIETLDRVLQEPDWQDVLDRIEFINNDQITGAGKTTGMVRTALPNEPMFGATNGTVEEILRKIRRFRPEVENWDNVWTVDKMIFKLVSSLDSLNLRLRLSDTWFDPAHVEDGRYRLACDEMVTMHPGAIIVFGFLYTRIILPPNVTVQYRLEGDTAQNVWYAGPIIKTNSALIGKFWGSINKTQFNPVTRRCPKDVMPYLSTVYGVPCKTTNPIERSIKVPQIVPLDSFPYEPDVVYMTATNPQVGIISQEFRTRPNYQPSEKAGAVNNLRVVQGASTRRTAFCDAQSHSSNGYIHSLRPMQLVCMSRHEAEFASYFVSNRFNPIYDTITGAIAMADSVTDWSQYVVTEAEVPPPVRWLVKKQS